MQNLKFFASIFDKNLSDEQILKELEFVDLLNKKDDFFYELSTGMVQKLSFARAMLLKPQILILDEPTSHLDFGNQITVLKIIKKLASKGISIIMATHTPEHAFFAGTSACILQSGKITKWGKPLEIITEENINRAFSTEIKIIIDKDGTKACVPAI